MYNLLSTKRYIFVDICPVGRIKKTHQRTKL